MPYTHIYTHTHIHTYSHKCRFSLFSPPHHISGVYDFPPTFKVHRQEDLRYQSLRSPAWSVSLSLLSSLLSCLSLSLFRFLLSCLSLSLVFDLRYQSLRLPAWSVSLSLLLPAWSVSLSLLSLLSLSLFFVSVFAPHLSLSRLVFFCLFFVYIHTHTHTHTGLIGFCGVVHLDNTSTRWEEREK